MGTEHWLVTPSLKKVIWLGKNIVTVLDYSWDTHLNQEGNFKVKQGDRRSEVLATWLAENLRDDTVLSDDICYEGGTPGLFRDKKWAVRPGWECTDWYHSREKGWYLVVENGD